MKIKHQGICLWKYVKVINHKSSFTCLVCIFALHSHTLTLSHTDLHTGSQGFTLSAPHGERFVQQQLSEEVSWDSALKVFQVIWLRCLPEAPDNGSFTFLWLESSSFPRPVKHQLYRSPKRAGEREERAGRWDSCSTGPCLCRGEKDSLVQSMWCWRE